MLEKDLSFTNNLKLNLDNARECLKWCVTHNREFQDTYLNETIVKLKTLIEYPDGMKCRLHPPKPNKDYSDLLERYVHLSSFDPCSYRHVIRDLLLAGTKTVELDITAESVYIYAKYITKDSDLLCTYMDNDIYTIIPDMTRAEQKVLMQKWLAGGYNPKIPYNEMFPISAAYLKQTGNWTDGSYKRNSGLFRDIETRNLITICELCGKKILGHLHDAVYTTVRGFDDAAKAFKQIYGSAIKFKRLDYATLSDNVYDRMESIDWGTGSLLPAEQFDRMQQLKDSVSIMRTGHAGCFTGFYLGEELPDEIVKAIAAYRICNGESI